MSSRHKDVRLARQVHDACARMVGELLVTDRVQEVRLVQADAAAQKDRVVLGRVARGGGLRGREGELVGWPREDRFRSVSIIEC
jgi:hypothetical protein